MKNPPQYGALTTDLRTQFQSAVGNTYTIERELGGGGMSRVFVATETSLGRKVVVKVLPPEMAAGVNVDRLRREIQLAASLQHPHIVPLHTAGCPLRTPCGFSGIWLMHWPTRMRMVLPIAISSPTMCSSRAATTGAVFR